MRLTELTEEALTDELIDRLIFDRSFFYNGGKADIIMVLGSRKGCKHRIPAAAEIFRSGGAPLLLFCGGKVQDTPLGHMAEYISMLRTADSLGVPRDVIITEERSLTTEENFAFARKILEEQLPQCRNIILVTAHYHMRRALLMAERGLQGYNIIPAAALSGSCTADGWKLTERSRAKAREEALKLRWYAEQGRIDDMEV